MKNKTQEIVMSSLLAALICVATMIIKIQTFKGYINLGDCVVLLSGWILSPMYAFLTAGVGSLLADIFSGYVIYAPVTFLIKGFMALICCYGLKLFKKKPFVSRIVSGILAEVVMVIGYYIFEGFMYGFISSAVNIPSNTVQGIFGIVLAVILIKVFEKSDIKKSM